MRKSIAVCVIALFMPVVAMAMTKTMPTIPLSVKTYMPDAKIVGKGRMRYLAWEVYDATLYAPKGLYAPGKSMALTLGYLRPLKGKEIADRSIQEMRGQGFKDEASLLLWQKRMISVFPNVVAGTILTGVRTTEGKTVFFKNNKLIGSIDNPEFSENFFGIWLNEKTSSPDLRKQLLGQL